uniref:Uncharacterized protein n=1 Tax=Glossina palpalis gambiensis TaxID=67801 RepID=A0A1B0AXJ8_9MUSC
MSRSVQQPAVQLQENMQVEFRRQPCRLEEVIFDGRPRYQLTLNHHREWRVIELPWLPTAMHGPYRIRDTEVPRALPFATTQPDCQLFSKADQIQSPSSHRITDLPTVIFLNAAGENTRMFAEFQRTGAPDRRTVVIDERYHRQLPRGVSS